MAVFVADEQSAQAVDIERLRALARHVLTAQRVPAAMELSVLCVDAETIAQLNDQHMGVKGATDVLAFPIDQPGESMGGEPVILGDVVLCPEVAARQAAAHGATAPAEMELLLVHGILHLLGHDHTEAGERAAMFGLTDALLVAFRSAAAAASVAGGSAAGGPGSAAGVAPGEPGS